MAKKCFSLLLALLTLMNLAVPALAAGIDEGVVPENEPGVAETVAEEEMSASATSAMPVIIGAPEDDGEAGTVLTETHVQVNPLYKNLITEESLDQPSPIATIVYPYSASSISGAAEYMRGQMERRVASISVTVPQSQYYSTLWEDLPVLAYDHTGEPTEGDYIAYQFGGYRVTTSFLGSNVQFDYTVTYYDTLAQEQRVDAVLPGIMAGLGLSGKNDYQKVKAIYDWICANVEYDWANLNNENYTLQYTAYGALIDRTAVCQGYAVLFYRMALEAGVDARVVSGYGGGGRHAWNIARMYDGYYYYLDTTWDAGKTRYSYFLKCQANFNDHQNASGGYGDVGDYTSAAWKSKYPIGPRDFDPNTAVPVTPSPVTPKPVTPKPATPSPATPSPATPKPPTQLAAPKVSKIENVNGGVKISWGKVSGAAKYRVYYKTSGGSWKTLVNTTATSYTWKGAKSGTKYTFRVRCVNSSATSVTSGYDKDRSITYIAAPKNVAVSSTSTGVKISWTKSAGAAKYRVYYKTGSGSWKTLVNTTASSYTWKGAKNGTRYTFRVRCVNSAATSVTSGYTADKSITYKKPTSSTTSTKLAAPKVSKVENVNGGVKISWGKVSGAAKYRVYYKTGGGSWKTLVNTTATSYTWKGAKSGTKYTFRVRCVNKAATAVTSGYDKDRSITYIAAPDYIVYQTDYNEILLLWDDVPGATWYRVYYKVNGGSWKSFTPTSNAFLYCTGAKSGYRYTFRVRCVNSSGDVISSYIPDITITYW